MKKTNFALGIGAVAALFLFSCKSGGSFKTTPDGLQYNIVDDKKGDEHPKYGDIVTMNVSTVYGDSVLYSSMKFNGGKPVDFPLTQPTFKGDIPEGITLLSKGDSAVFRVPVDSLEKAGAQLLPIMKKGTFLEYRVRLVDFKSAQQAQQEAMDASKEQMAIDDELLTAYFTKNNLTPTKTSTGLYYIIEKPGTGANAQPGQTVSVMYTGKTLEGKVFDSNMEPTKGEPFTFKLGAGQAIAGWDEGIAYFNKGAKGKLFVPSPMAYGPNSPNPNVIKPNEVLLFDVEVTDIKP